VKGTIIIFAVALLSIGCKSQQVQDRTIKLTVTETSDYCGGAAPNEELMLELLKEKPFTGTIYVHSISDRTDDGQKLVISNGELKQSGFSEGVYFVYFHPKFDREDPANAKLGDEKVSCLEMVSFQHSAKFFITKETKSVNFNVHKMCDPCSPPRP